MHRGNRLTGPLLSVLAFTAVAVAWAGLLLYKGGGLPDLQGGKYEVSAVIPSGAALASGARVTVAGVEAGRIKEVEREGRSTRVLLELDDENVVPLPADSRVQVRQHTPVGENYIGITAGRAKETIASGGAVPVEQADEFVDVDRLLSVLQGETRERARRTIQSLGEPLERNGERLNTIVGEGSRFLSHSGQLLRTLTPARASASRLVDQLGDLTAAIGQRDAAIRTIARKGLVGLDAMRDRDEALRRTIDELPGSLRRIRATSGTLRTVSAVTRPVVDDARAALRGLQPAVDRLPAATTAGRGVLRDLGAAAPGLRGTLRDATRLSQLLPAALPKLQQVVCEVAPIARYIKPYFPEALHILTGLSSVSNSYDATGNLLRLAPIFGQNSLSGYPDEIQNVTRDLIYGGALGKLGPHLNYDPYPEPGSLGSTKATSNRPSGPEDQAAQGFRYQRVEADC